MGTGIDNVEHLRLTGDTLSFVAPHYIHYKETAGGVVQLFLNSSGAKIGSEVVIVSPVEKGAEINVHVLLVGICMNLTGPLKTVPAYHNALWVIKIRYFGKLSNGDECFLMEVY